MNSDHKFDVRPDRASTLQSVNHLGTMIRERRLTKEFFETEEFSETWDKVQVCLNGHSRNDVWTALSVVGRASSISKPAETVFLPAVKRRLAEPLPDWCELEDGEDRYYLAKALQVAPNRQIVDLAFTELAREDVAEKARRIWASIAFAHSSSREEFLAQINKCITHVKQEQDMTVDSLIRRIRRISNAIAEDLATADVPTGSRFGGELSEFYAGRAIASGPEDRELREVSAEEFVRSLARIARLNFRAASDPSVYGIVGILRRWWQPASPPRTFEVLSRKMAHTGIDALHIFARQGVPNYRLRQAITDACGKKIVDLLSKSVATADASLSEDISYWFVHGSRLPNQRSTAAIDAISGKRLDEYVARLLVSASSPDSNYRTLRAVADQVSLLLPEEANTVSRAANCLSQITQWSRAVARSQNIELTAERGDIVSYDPTVHDANEDCVVGADVVVSAPGAIKSVPGRPQILILKIEVRRK